MTRTFTRFRLVAALVAVIGFVALLPAPVAAQTAPITTTLSAAVSTDSQNIIPVTSATGFNVSDAPIGKKFIYIDKELDAVNSVSGTMISVTRGIGGTRVTPHASGTAVAVGVAPMFPARETSAEGRPLSGTCTSANELYLPIYSTDTGRRWNCIGSQWMVDTGVVVLPPQACQSSVSGNSTGTNGFTSLGTAPSLPAVNAQTSATGTNTHYFMCNLNMIKGATAAAQSGNIALIDVVAHYGVQSNAIGTQAVTLASGTMNSKIVFTKIAYPAAKASETATGLAEAARADSGTMVLVPAVASFNTATTTAGEFYSEQFIPGAPFFMNTDLNQYLFTMSLLNGATTATITNLAGITVHFAYLPD